MLVQKLICRFITSLLLVAAVLLPNPASAELTTITATGDYNMSENETLLVAKERAVYVAMRNAVEQAGVYIESYSQIKNLQLTKDEVNMIASGIVEVTDKKFTRKLTETGGDFISVTITCKVNTDNIQAMHNKLQDKSTMETLKKVQSDYEKAMQENALLKQQLAQATTVQGKQQVEQKIAQNEQSFTAIQWFNKGYDYQVNNKDYDNAIIAYTRSIQLNPQDADAYFNRGIAFRKKGQNDSAIADYSKVIELNPQKTNAYYGRGLAYYYKEQYDLAIIDYTKAIQLNPQYSDAYYNKAIACAIMGRNSEAIQSYKLFLQYAPSTDTDIETAKQQIRKLGGTI